MKRNGDVMEILESYDLLQSIEEVMFPHFGGVGIFDSLMPLTPLRRSACRGGTRRSSGAGSWI